MSQTKLALGNALKQLVHEKPFEKISVSDITDKCNLNRQTFYYHFQDKFECLEYYYYHECLEPMIQSISLENWEDCIEEMLVKMKENAEFYTRTIYASPKSFITPFFETTKNLFKKAIHVIDEEDKVDDDEEEFISEFLTQGIIGIITSWVSKGMLVSPQDLSRRLKKMAIDMEQINRQRRHQ